jgi:hypothetical protein
MFGNSCPDCVAFFAEMHSAIMEANAITENAKALRCAGDRRSPPVPKWWEITESWENARRRWRKASMELKITLQHTTVRPSQPRGWPR